MGRRTTALVAIGALGTALAPVLVAVSGCGSKFDLPTENRAGPEIEQNLNQLPQFHADANSQIGQAGCDDGATSLFTSAIKSTLGDGRPSAK